MIFITSFFLISYTYGDDEDIIHFSLAPIYTQYTYESYVCIYYQDK
jgi:hypothetical protein